VTTALRSPFAAGFGPGAAVDLADTLKALAEPSRLRILAILRAEGPLTGVEIETRLGTLKQPSIAHHLRILGEAGLVTATKHGAYVVRELATDRLLTVAALLTPGGER